MLHLNVPLFPVQFYKLDLVQSLSAQIFIILKHMLHLENKSYRGKGE